MQMINKKFYGIFIFLLFFFGSARAQYHENAEIKSYTFPNPYAVEQLQEPGKKKVRNVILMIGDGMGLNQISMAWVANRGKLNLDNFKQSGLVRTYAADKLITDSGAAGTAMATGQKARYHSIGVDVNGNPVPSLTDLAHKKGLSTAVVVTCGLTDATPATFCASNPDREQLDAIANDFLDCDVDFLFGGGRAQFTEREDSRNLLHEMEEIGYQVATSWEQMENVSEGKVFAAIEEGQLPMAPERGDIWQKASLKALNRLKENPKGFFAVLEGSRIDDCGHWHDLPGLMGEIFDFDQTIGKVLKWAEKDGETLVIVLADHETGGLTLLDGDIQKGTVKGHFSTGGHSGIMVPVYAWGPQSEKFTGTFENTAIFQKIVQILKLN